jgi:hypothetical protein
LALRLKSPVSSLVMVRAEGFSTPRMLMHRC